MTDKYFLALGSHTTREQGMCAMEWTAYIAGEHHTDRPVCVSPILRSFCTSLNDAWDDGMRQRLRPYLARCIGTASDGLDRERRFMCLDWQIRTFLPTWLELAGLHSEAAEVRALAPIVDLPSAQLATPIVQRAWAAVWDAARAAAGAALQPSVALLQESALDLLDRMLPKVAVDLPVDARTRAVEVCGV